MRVGPAGRWRTPEPRTAHSGTDGESGPLSAGDPSGWTLATLNTYFQRQLDDLRAMLDERYRTQTEALKAAFAAQETAVKVQLTAQERAVTKAEVAADKRFDLLNELRVGVATKEQVEALDKRLNEMTARVDRNEGGTAGSNVEQRLQNLTKALGDTAAQLSTGTGRTAGARDLFGVLIGAGGIILAIAAWATR